MSHSVLLWVTALLIGAGCVDGEYSGCNSRTDVIGGNRILTLRDCRDSYDVGYAIGDAFRHVIHARLDESGAIRKILDYANTTVGYYVIKAILAMNEESFPDIWPEIVGLAHGSGRPVEEIAMLNLRQEITAGIPRPAHGRLEEVDADACSDGLLSVQQTDGSWRAWVGHNEDMTNDTLEHVFYVRYFGAEVSWFAFAYAGEIITPAFGFNSHGFAFTLNAVFPKQPLTPGLGRNFVSRTLLDAHNISTALKALEIPLQAVGHSYNLMSTDSQHVMNVEVAPLTQHNILNVTEHGFYFHANVYQHMPSVTQRMDNSSVHRLAVASTYKDPTTPEEVLYLLGDTSDELFPIWRTGDGNGHVYTLTTALFDLQAKRLTLFKGNPRNNDVSMWVDMATFELHHGPSHLRALGRKGSAWQRVKAAWDSL